MAPHVPLGPTGALVEPWTLLDTAWTPQDTELSLWVREHELVIRADGLDLMSNRAHGSEEEMVSFARLQRPDARVLVGGLGMGYTLRAVLDALPPEGRVTVAELSADVVRWNREILGPLAMHPLEDPRVDVVVGDIGDVMQATPGQWDAILMDVDNGPHAFTMPANERLYGVQGLNIARMALRQPGTLAVWSAFEDAEFLRRIGRAGMQARLARVQAHKDRGADHVIFLGYWG